MSHLLNFSGRKLIITCANYDECVILKRSDELALHSRGCSKITSVFVPASFKDPPPAEVKDPPPAEVKYDRSNDVTLYNVRVCCII